MSEGWLMICFGIFLVVNAFVISGVSNKVWPGGKISPPTKRLRVAIFLIGLFAVILGADRLMHK